jgi:hypothetical protein
VEAITPLPKEEAERIARDAAEASRAEFEAVVGRPMPEWSWVGAYAFPRCWAFLFYAFRNIPPGVSVVVDMHTRRALLLRYVDLSGDLQRAGIDTTPSPRREVLEALFLPQELRLDVFADDRQFHVVDAGESGASFEDAFTDASLADRFARATCGNGVCVMTGRNTPVPVTVRVQQGPPEDAPGFPGWDHVADGALEVRSGSIAVMGCTEDVHAAPDLQVPPGRYAVRAYFTGLDTVDTAGLQSEDSYRVVLWPAEDHAFAVLKRHPLPGD